MKPLEIQIKDRTSIPKNLYHIVPERIFLKFTNNDNSYDCRNKIEWGMNEDFIHTTSNPRILKERIADLKWKHYDLSEKFILLNIETNKIRSKITYAVYNDIKYYHIWSGLPRKCFSIHKVGRNNDGTFIL